MKWSWSHIHICQNYLDFIRFYLCSLWFLSVCNGLFALWPYSGSGF
jgi:hypothetical protein